MKLTATLHNMQQGHAAIMAMWQQVKPWLAAGHKLQIEIKQETRNSAQNAKIHALLTDISNQVEWAGEKRDVETWKRLLTAAWCRANDERVEVLPAIDGLGVDIVFRRTSKLNINECSSLIEYIYYWASSAGVKFRAERHQYEHQ